MDKGLEKKSNIFGVEKEMYGIVLGGDVIARRVEEVDYLSSKLLAPILHRYLRFPVRDEGRSIGAIVRGSARCAIGSLGVEVRLGFDCGLIQAVGTSETSQGPTVGLSPKLHTWACHSGWEAC